ncbi:MAG: methyl-accepting chemotaxis protein [Gammaproteobacteria bacterium]|nr:methyl-accepting chemotaxis protein [Gammaproteobacteria bacterium]
MKRIAQFLSRYLTLLVLAPCLLLIGLVLFDVSKATMQVDNSDQDKMNITISKKILELIHEVQKERGMSAGYLGSEGKSFRNRLTNQHTLVDEKFAELKEVVTENSSDERIAGKIESLVAQLEQRNKIRSEVSALSINLNSALSYYTSANTQGFEIISDLAHSSNNRNSAANLFAIYNFSNAKESSGIERAVVANMLSSKSYPKDLVQRHIQLVSNQNIYLKEALVLGSGNLNSLFKTATDSQEFLRVQSIREKVFAQNAVDISAEAWFDAATKRIDVLKQTEQNALDQVVNKSEEIKASAIALLTYEIIVMLLGILITWFLIMNLRLRQNQAKGISLGIDKAANQRDLIDEIEILSDDDLGKSAHNINMLTSTFSKDLLDFNFAATGIVEATNETGTAIKNSYDNLQEQRSRVEMIAAAAEEMNANIQVIAESMRSNAETAKQVLVESQNGQGVVTTAVTGIESIAAGMLKAVESIEQLNSRVGGIAEIVSMIQSIAEQTNLLALNAAIEAARAGEQGRGFAVVADEVRNLASRTQECTEQISSLVKELQDSASVTSTSINNGQKEASSVASSTDEIKQALQLIVDQVSKVEETTETISVNITEQCSALEEVTSNINGIYSNATENVAGAEQIGVATANIAKSAMKMIGLIEQYEFTGKIHLKKNE